MMHRKKSRPSSSRFWLRSVLVVLLVLLFFLSTVQAAGSVGSLLSGLQFSATRLDRPKRDASVISTPDADTSARSHRRRHRHSDDAVATTTDNSTLLEKLRSNTKRCRYSSADQEELENYARRNQLRTATTYEESFNYYGNSHLDDERYHQARNHSGYRSGGFVKQPRVREQSGRHHGHGHHGHHQGLLDPPVEIEKLFVDIGETINLTCNINAKEIDWHFKDKNLTTTIISNGPYLQVEQAQIALADALAMQDNEERIGALSSSASSSSSRFGNVVLKYRLSSDRHSRHMLTLYVQGNQDEGSYQCIDSKSEAPIKKTIRVILKNNSRALTSGMASRNASIFSWLLALALIAINRRHLA